MRQRISKAVRTAKNLNEVRDLFIGLCKQIREEDKAERIGYVAGILFSDGPEYFERNVKQLENHTEKLKTQYHFPIFSAIDIFYDEDFYTQLPETELLYTERRQLFLNFYRSMLKCGYITDIFMTPRWEESEGARDEHETAKKAGITLHYVT